MPAVYRLGLVTKLDAALFAAYVTALARWETDNGFGGGGARRRDRHGRLDRDERKDRQDKGKPAARRRPRRAAALREYAIELAMLLSRSRSAPSRHAMIQRRNISALPDRLTSNVDQSF